MSNHIDIRNPALLHKAGMDALVKELGVVGAVSFLQQYDRGEGNYTKERTEIYKDMSVDDILGAIKNQTNKQLAQA